jgi:hypothetical protein
MHGMALTPLPSSIRWWSNPRPSDREPSTLPLDHRVCACFSWECVCVRVLVFLMCFYVCKCAWECVCVCIWVCVCFACVFENVIVLIQISQLNFLSVCAFCHSPANLYNKILPFPFHIFTWFEHGNKLFKSMVHFYLIQLSFIWLFLKVY